MIALLFLTVVVASVHVCPSRFLSVKDADPGCCGAHMIGKKLRCGTECVKDTCEKVGWTWGKYHDFFQCCPGTSKRSKEVKHENEVRVSHKEVKQSTTDGGEAQGRRKLFDDDDDDDDDGDDDDDDDDDDDRRRKVGGHGKGKGKGGKGKGNTKGNTTESSTTESSTTQGSTAESTTTEGSTIEGSTTESTKGSTSQGSSAESTTTEGSRPGNDTAQTKSTITDGKKIEKHSARREALIALALSIATVFACILLILGLRSRRTTPRVHQPLTKVAVAQVDTLSTTKNRTRRE
eukprot:GEMP01048307.1.p1 GENE.GEMP01048307.1~~GEMP01048307.1.p1  ORF type:complete len:292 (+),score=81.49 GEMP01048307.1:663-1538(+)